MAHKGLIGSLAFLAACSGTEVPVVRPVTQPTSVEATTGQPATTQPPEPTVAPEPTVVPEPTVAPQPTVAPEPTVVLEPTVVPEPTVAPEPTRESASQAPESGSVAIVEPQSAGRATLPAFVEPPAAFSSLVGTEFEGTLEPFDYRPDNLVGGGAVININAEGENRAGLSWRVEDDRVPMAISSSRGHSEEGKAQWQLKSVWLLQLPPDSNITNGNDVCKADEPTHEYGEEFFLVVTNSEQDTALGAWIITTEGPVEYEAFADLQCERFFP